MSSLVVVVVSSRVCFAACLLRIKEGKIFLLPYGAVRTAITAAHHTKQPLTPPRTDPAAARSAPTVLCTVSKRSLEVYILYILVYMYVISNDTRRLLRLFVHKFWVFGHSICSMSSSFVGQVLFRAAVFWSQLYCFGQRCWVWSQSLSFDHSFIVLFKHPKFCILFSNLVHSFWVLVTELEFWSQLLSLNENEDNTFCWKM